MVIQGYLDFQIDTDIIWFGSSDDYDYTVPDYIQKFLDAYPDCISRTQPSPTPRSLWVAKLEPNQLDRCHGAGCRVG